MRRGTCVAAALAALLLSAVALANPIAMEVVRAKQVPFTTYVQLSYGVDGKAPATPTAVTRDGTSIIATWTALASYTANTGSGLKSVQATQACDCNAAVGKHDYKITVMGAGGKETTLTASINVVANLGDPKDAGPLGDMHPWDIPEPGQMQGLDCKAKCAATNDGPQKKDVGTPGADKGTTPSADKGATTGPDKGTTKPASGDDGGCSFGGPARAASLAALALALCGLALALRRRR